MSSSYGAFEVLIWTSLLVSIFPVESKIIQLPYGKLRGRDNGFYYSYESIPYAEPPVGVLRFEPPQPYRRHWKNLFEATKPPVPCMQWNQFTENPTNHSRLRGAEDCLTVNIYTPKSSTNRTYPVVVAIHGGAFMFGGVADYQPQRIMSAGKSILVSISYRLGPLGFLSAGHKDLSGNFGLKDQRLALEWIKKNIANFGGEPNNIVLIGHSAGGASVNFQLLRPDFHTLVRGAVSVSGVALNPWAMSSMAREHAFAIGDILNCPHNGNALQLKRCLQSKPAEAIVSTVAQFQVFGYVPFTMFGPVIENAAVPKAFLTQHPRQIMKAGKHSQVPWLVTYTKEDGGYNAATLLERKVKTQRELIEQLNTRWLDLAPHYLFYGKQGPSTYSKSLAIRKRYLGNRAFNLASYSALEKMFTDVLFKDGVEEVMQLLRSHKRSRLYAYLYDNPTTIGEGQYLAKRNDLKFGTVHGDDYFLMMPLTLKNNVLRPDERIIVQNFYNMLANFARSGQLQFGACRFVENANKPKLQLMQITRNGCKNVNVEKLP